MRAGVLATVTAMPWRPKNAEPPGPDTFFPSLKDDDKGGAADWDTPEGQHALARMYSILSEGGGGGGN